MMTRKTNGGNTITLRSRKRPSGKSALFLDITENGKRRMEYLKLYLTNGTSRADKAIDKETMRIAETIRSKRLIELQNRMAGIKNDIAGEVKILDFMQKIIDRKDGTTKTSWENCMAHIKRYEPNRELTFGDVGNSWVEGFREYLDKTPAWSIDSRKRPSKTDKGVIAQGTKALMFQKFCSVFNLAFRQGIISRNPTLSVEKFKESYAPREFLTLPELRILMKSPAPDEKVAKAFIFSCLTGMRWSDIVPLKWGDIEKLGTHYRIVFTQKKTGGLEYLDISDQAVRILGDRGADNELIFDGITTRQNARVNVTAWVKSAGIDKHITFHCGRHTFATMMLDLGVDLYTVSKLLGHKNIETTQVYAKILDKNKQAAIDRIPDLF